MRYSINRRVVLTAAVCGGAVALSGCGRISRLADTKGRALSRAAGDTEGVASADIRVGREAEFRPYAIGDITCTATDRDEVVADYERAMRTVVTIIHDDTDFSDGMVVERIEGVGAPTAEGPGERVTLQDLGIRGRWEKDFHGNPRRGQIYAETCYDHFGLA